MIDMKRKIGIYAGTFDPLHEGHLAFARETLKTCHLDKVMFLPEPTPRHKPQASPIADRYQYIRKTIGQSPFYKVHHSRHDKFTYSSLMPEITDLFPDATFVIMIGSDVASNLSRWKDLDKLAAGAQFAIGMRDTHTETEITTILDNLQRSLGYELKYTIVSADYADVSSSQKRLGLSQALS